MTLAYVPFSTVDIKDSFFDSLKRDYAEFDDWFKRKADARAYVMRGENGAIEGFLYLKVEDGRVDDVEPALHPARRIKIGTLKINPHGTRLGERFLKKVFDHALSEKAEEIYVTVFEKHGALIELLRRYGFKIHGTKTTPNGDEQVLVKTIRTLNGSVAEQYPLVKLRGQSIYLLALHPQWHSRLLPDSILRGEDAGAIVQDVSHSNSIHKVYLAGMGGMEALQPGDVLLIYRTTDRAGPARYRSVVTSVCVLEEYRHISSFATLDEFVSYCAPYSIFDRAELGEFWASRKYPHVIRFTYNFALPKRVTRDTLIVKLDFPADEYYGFMKISEEQFRRAIREAQLDETLIVD